MRQERPLGWEVFEGGEGGREGVWDPQFPIANFVFSHDGHFGLEGGGGGATRLLLRCTAIPVPPRRPGVHQCSGKSAARVVPQFRSGPTNTSRVGPSEDRTPVLRSGTLGRTKTHGTHDQNSRARTCPRPQSRADLRTLRVRRSTRASARSWSCSSASHATPSATAMPPTA